MGGGYGGPPPASGSGGPNKGLLVILGLLVVAAIGGGIFLLAGGDDDDDSTELSDRDQDEDTDLDLPDINDDEDPPTTEDSDTPTGDYDLGEISGMSDAEDVILSFVAHEVDKDCSAMYTLLSSTFRNGYNDEAEFVTECDETYNGFGDMEVDTLTVTSVTDSQIDIASDQTIDRQSHAATYTMVLEDGTWWLEAWD